MSRWYAKVALGGRLTPVGDLRYTRTGPRQFSTFSYDPAWVESAPAFPLQPDLPLEGSPFHASGQGGNVRDALAGAFADAAPDTWGRTLLERVYGAGLSEFEYLTLSDDSSRQGALRFLDEEGKVIKGDAPDAIPRLVDLAAITAIARAYEQGKDVSAEDMRALVGAGGSGGARPKANVIDEGTLWLAKFTSVHDQQPVERVEVATLRLAASCGIRTPEVRLELDETPFPVALIKRFDRQGSGRVPYISARTALGKSADQSGSYTEIADFIRQASPDPADDFLEIYRRLVFTILVSNKDDHLKNHGFLYVGERRWRLSPMFDVNPAPDRNPHLETAIYQGGKHDRSVLLTLDAAEFFDIAPADARTLIRDMAHYIAENWREALGMAGIKGAIAQHYKAAFVHDEAQLALGL